MEERRQAIGSHRVYRELRARALRLRDILHATQGRIADRAAVTAAGATDQPPALHADKLWGYAMLAHLRNDAELPLTMHKPASAWGIPGGYAGDPRLGLEHVVKSVSSSWRLSVDEQAKPHGGLARCRSHDQMQIAGVEAVRDPPVGRVQRCGLPLHRPITRRRPLIEPQLPPTR